MRRDGALALIFVNTSVDDPLTDYAGLVAWARAQEALSSAEASRLFELAARKPDEAATAFSAAKDLHGVLSEIFNALADGGEPRAEQIEALNSYLRDALAPRQLRPRAGTFGWVLADSHEADLNRPLGPVVASAADILASTKRVGRCAREGCGVLFLRRNPGLPRKWCGWTCGHRVREKRRYHKKVKGYKLAIRRRTRAVLEAERKTRAAERSAKAARK